MKIRSIDELSDALSSQLAWRKKELSQIKYLVDTSKIPTSKKTVIIRSGITMIYAHWEGFIKIGGRYYLEYIASKRLNNSDLPKSLLTISLCSSQNIFEGTSKYSYYSSIIDFLKDSMDSRAKIPYESVIDTESNLSSTVFKEIIWCLDLSYDEFETKEKLIDHKLLAKRNHIAHGEYLDIDEEDLIEIRDTIIGMMNQFKNQILNSAVTKDYLI